MNPQDFTDLVTSVESLKIRLARAETVLCNFMGVSKDSDGSLNYAPKAPVAVETSPASTVPPLELESGAVLEPEKESDDVVEGGK